MPYRLATPQSALTCAAAQLCGEGPVLSTIEEQPLIDDHSDARFGIRRRQNARHLLAAALTITGNFDHPVTLTEAQEATLFIEFRFRRR